MYMFLHNIIRKNYKTPMKFWKYSIKENNNWGCKNTEENKVNFIKEVDI